MRWYEEYRVEWIREMLRIYGFINRRHVELKFGLSTPQASKDLASFMKKHPDAMYYDPHSKMYKAFKYEG